MKTRMHSSRMRTGQTLTVFRWRPPRKFGGPPPENWRTPPKIWRNPPKNLEDPPENLEEPPRKFGGTPPYRPPWTIPPPPPVDRITDACKNITLAKTSFQPVTMLSTQHRITGSDHALPCQNDIGRLHDK